MMRTPSRRPSPRPADAAQRRERRALPAAALALAAVVALPASALADEPRSATEPRVMEEPGEVVSVIDAFDDGDPFDLHVSLGFEFSSKSAKIRRETHINQPGLTTGGFTSKLMNVAAYSQSTSKLVPRIDIGIYKDLALHVKLPIVLNDSRKLEDLDGSAARADVVAQGGPGETLFTLPFESPDRSGLEHIAIGIDLDILSQARDRSKPTWLFGLEGRFSVGTPMHACNPSPKSGQVKCADPSDVNRDGQSDGRFDGVDVAERDPGVTRGTVGLAARTLMSKRMKYIEPYGGFDMLLEFQQDSSDYGITDLEGSLVNHPPFSGGMILGVMVHPWENREKYGRLSFDMKLTGQYHSEGRDYSELFDALGSTDAASMRNPQYARYQRNPAYDEAACADGDPGTSCLSRSVIDEGSQKTYFTGLTDVQAYGSYRGAASVLWQASEYVKFQLGFGLSFDQGHGISSDQPCNPSFKDKPDEAGPCASGGGEGQSFAVTGLPNPNYRPTTNAVGRRFYVEDSTTFDVFASGTVMF